MAKNNKIVNKDLSSIKSNKGVVKLITLINTANYRINISFKSNDTISLSPNQIIRGVKFTDVDVASFDSRIQWSYQN